MSDTVIVSNPKLDDEGNPIKDQYGRYIYEKMSSIARVQHTTKVIRDSQGQELHPKLEIVLPSETRVGYGSEIDWTDRFGQPVKGSVVSIDESLNYSGNQVYFRTVYIG